MTDRDPRWAGGGLWAVIILGAIAILAVAYFLTVLGAIA